MINECRLEETEKDAVLSWRQEDDGVWFSPCNQVAMMHMKSDSAFGEAEVEKSFGDERKEGEWCSTKFESKQWLKFFPCETQE